MLISLPRKNLPLLLLSFVIVSLRVTAQSKFQKGTNKIVLQTEENALIAWVKL